MTNYADGNSLYQERGVKIDDGVNLEDSQMTLDHIFDPLPVDPNPPGIFDKGLQYMLDAASFVGAQNKRLAHTAQNITTEMENLTASESTIRDADMAKEFTSWRRRLKRCLRRRISCRQWFWNC